MKIDVICKSNYIRVTDGFSYVEAPYIKGLPEDPFALVKDIAELLFFFFQTIRKKFPRDFEIEVLNA